MAEYYDRLIERIIEKKMKSSGAIAIEGPKFCGKTTTALRYAKSDVRLNTHQRIELARMQPKNVLKGDTPRVIDEWQTVPGIWNEVKAWIDENPDFGQFILTGSSTPADKTDIYHSGAGRITTIAMKPMSLTESKESSCTVSLKELFESNRSITTPKNPSIVADGGCSYVGLIILRPEACVFRFPLSSCRSRA